VIRNLIDRARDLARTKIGELLTRFARSRKVSGD
jgi:hypothetical protein